MSLCHKSVLYNLRDFQLIATMR